MVHLDPRTPRGLQRGAATMSTGGPTAPPITPRPDQFEAFAAILDALAHGRRGSAACGCRL